MGRQQVNGSRAREATEATGMAASSVQGKGLTGGATSQGHHHSFEGSLGAEEPSTHQGGVGGSSRKAQGGQLPEANGKNISRRDGRE